MGTQLSECHAKTGMDATVCREACTDLGNVRFRRDVVPSRDG